MSGMTTLKRPANFCRLMPYWGVTFLAATAVGLTACGGATEEGNSDRKDPGAAGPSTAASEEAAVLAVTRKYLNGIADKDWGEVCDARSEQEQASLGRQAGGRCEDAVSTIYDTEQFQRVAESLGSAEPESVSVDGNQARVSYGSAAISSPCARRVNGGSTPSSRLLPAATVPPSSS